jgi:hypothetical protein
MTIPSIDEERRCYEAFYDATSNDALSFQTCPICARKKLKREGEETALLSDSSVTDILMTPSADELRRKRGKSAILRHLLEIDDTGITCWICWDCLRDLERKMLPKLSLANNLWIGDIPDELSNLTIPEQLLIARYYPRCYIFKLFPRDIDTRIPLDQLYTGMAGNASLFELNTQEVVEMVKGQRMPASAQVLASIIAITFVSSKTLPLDWLKKTFRVRRRVVHDALLWLHQNNSVYADIQIDRSRLEDLPEDDVPDELISVVRQEEDTDSAEKERESYLCEENMMSIDSHDVGK